MPHRLLPLVLALLTLSAASAAKVTLTQQGLAVDAGTLGSFNLGYPALEAPEGKWNKPAEVKLTVARAALAYPGGARLGVEVKPTGEVALTFAAKPAAGKFRMDGLLGFELANGGAFRVDQGEFKPFPAAQPPGPMLYQGNARSFTLKGLDGKALTFTLPPYAWMQVQDNREWNWKTFAWFFVTPVTDQLTYTLLIASDESGFTGPQVLCDRFGQNARQEFPGKVRAEVELQADIADEAAWLATLRRPERDPYGGLPGSGAKLGLKATGYFHVEEQGERWILVDPDGNAFFHRGICGFQPSDDYTYVAGRENVYEWLPPYGGEYHTAFRGDDRTAFSFYVANVIRKTGKPFDREVWSAEQIRRVRAWGFTSVGAFSGVPQAACEAARFPYVTHLPLDPWTGGIPRLPGITETWDPFDETLRARVERNFAERVAPRVDDPLLIGYYSINEPAYEDIPRVVPTLSGKYACKRKLVELLRGKYPAIDAFNAAWELNAESFDALADMGLPVTTRQAAEDVRAFTGLFLEEYYRLVHDTFRKYDPHHLLLGCRFQAGTINNEQLCRIAGKYLDVMSFNDYTYYLDKGLLRRVHAWTGLPLLLSEFHYSSPSDSGLPGGAKDVGSQAERGLAYRNYLEQAASTGFVLGVEWFTLIDQAFTGRWFSRYNGENGNTGLLSVADRPWRAMLSEMMLSNDRVYDVWLAGAAPYVYQNPRFSQSGVGRRVAKIPRAAGPMVVDGRTEGWPGTPMDTIESTRVVQGSTAEGVRAAFKLCWDDVNLYLLAIVEDPTPRHNEHAGDSLWSADAVELFLGAEKPDEGGPLLFTDRQVLLGAGEQPATFVVRAAAQPVCELAVVTNVDGKGYALEAALPFAALGFTPKLGQAVRFDLAVDDSSDGRSRRCQIVWNGTERDSGDRTGWGTAVFGQ